MTKEISPEEYEKAIPKDCEFQTYDQHFEQLLLCYGLMSSINRGVAHNCGICEFSKKNSNK